MSDPSGARRATSGDLRLIAELVRACRDELIEQRGGVMWSLTDARQEPVEPRIEKEINEPETLTVVGEYDGVGVGYAVAVLRSANDTRTFVQVIDLFTMMQARHVGVGEAMMNLCIQWAKEHSAFAIDAAVLPGTRDAKNFFEDFGLTARALTVSLKL